MSTATQVLRTATLAVLIPLVVPTLCEAQDTDWGLWTGVLFRHLRPESRFDWSGEYQVRLREDLTELKSHFVEFNGLYKATPAILSNFGYRFTIRPDRNESRLFAGLFGRQWIVKPKPDTVNTGLKLTHQVMYQRDFNAEFNEVLLDSNTLRYALYLQKPFTRRWVGLAVAGAMYTWNTEYTGLERVRVAAGFRYLRGARDAIQLLFVHEEKDAATGRSLRSNIIWMRYEVVF